VLQQIEHLQQIIQLNHQMISITVLLKLYQFIDNTRDDMTLSISGIWLIILEAIKPAFKKIDFMKEHFSNKLCFINDASHRFILIQIYLLWIILLVKSSVDKTKDTGKQYQQVVFYFWLCSGVISLLYSYLINSSEIAQESFEELANSIANIMDKIKRKIITNFHTAVRITQEKFDTDCLNILHGTDLMHILLDVKIADELPMLMEDVREPSSFEAIKQDFIREVDVHFYSTGNKKLATTLKNLIDYKPNLQVVDESFLQHCSMVIVKQIFSDDQKSDNWIFSYNEVAYFLLLAASQKYIGNAFGTVPTLASMLIATSNNNGHTKIISPGETRLAVKKYIFGSNQIHMEYTQICSIRDDNALLSKFSVKFFISIDVPTKDNNKFEWHIDDVALNPPMPMIVTFADNQPQLAMLSDYYIQAYTEFYSLEQFIPEKLAVCSLQKLQNIQLHLASGVDYSSNYARYLDAMKALVEKEIVIKKQAAS
jgi:hypothetical protein